MARHYFSKDYNPKLYKTLVYFVDDYSSELYNTCGVTLLLVAILQFFFGLDINAPTWVKVVATILVLIASVIPAIISVGGYSKIWKIIPYLFWKIIPYLIGISGVLLIITLYVSSENYLKAGRFLLFIFGALLNIFAYLVAYLLNRIGSNIFFLFVLTTLSILCFVFMYFFPNLPPKFISIPFSIVGIAYFATKS